MRQPSLPRRHPRFLLVLPPLVALMPVLVLSPAAAEDRFLDRFERVQLTETYYSEGANAGDIDRDGKADVVHGPFWFRGPDFATRHEIYPPKPQPTLGYADSFFSWIEDFNADGFNDVLAVGFPGTPAYVYENPGERGFDRHWAKHEVFDWVSNESPHFTDLSGDGRRDLVCTRAGHFGYATVDGKEPFKKWSFHIISEKVAHERFGHGLGVGDIDGDGKRDVISKDGWFRQPASLDGDPKWAFHRVEFAGPGGAEMHAYDVDGDGDADVITSLDAHAFGLAWHEQVREGDRISFRKHLIMGETPEDNPYGVLFTEPHTVQLADIDRDGLLDIVTGKTYWSHHRQSPLWDAGAVVYWFRLVRGAGGVDWVPHRADGEAGVGRQVVVSDLDGDGLLDIVAGGMKGCHLLRHRREKVEEGAWRDAQPRPLVALAAGLEPGEAARLMSVPDGFRVTLAAGEPDVHQPVAFAIDPRGRLWVAEAHTYPRRAPEGQGKDKILILEDTDGDGTLDRRKVFIDGLNLVSGLEVGFGGAWVGAAPYLLFIPDRDGDDRPDGEPQVLLDGFGYQDTHETLNGFNWGPDGWLYGCHGVFTHSNVGKPDTPRRQRVPMNAAIWRYHPSRHEFEVFAHGTSNPWGVDFDDRGQAFATACVIPHLYHVIQGARYERQAGRHFNPHTYEDLKTIADHVHYAGNIGDHAWWGHEPTLPKSTSDAGGGHAHCGAMVYLGDNWPERYRNRLYFNNVHGNRVNCDVLERRGSGYVGRHAPDFLLANDRWFRGINLKSGPDGTVHLIDWYDRNACHRTNPEIWDRSNGRIYRIAYGDAKPAKGDLARLSSAELVALARHPNDWHARTARRLLHERGPDAGVHAALGEILDRDPSVAVRLRALWALHATGGLREDRVLALLEDPEEHLRAWAIQLELEDRAGPPVFLAKLSRLAAEDPSPIVRLYLASALGRLPAAARWSIAEALVQHGGDAGDHNLPLMYWYGIEPLVGDDPPRALSLAAVSRIPLVTQFILRRAASETESLDALVAALGKGAAERDLVVLGEMLRAFQGRVDIPMPPAWSAAYDRLVASESEAVRERADEAAVLFGDRRILPRMREVLADPAADLERRRRALEIIVRGRDEGAAGALQAALDEPALRGAAIRALASHDDAGTPAAILERYERLGETEKRDAIGTLSARPKSALALLDAVDSKKIPRTDLHAHAIRQLLRFRDPAVEKRVREVWGEVRDTSEEKQAEVTRWKAMLSVKKLESADPGNGRRVFAKTCGTCHVLFGEGTVVGPDITGSNRADLDYVLENVLDPSATLAKEYRMTVVLTTDGRVVSGLLLDETESAVTLRTLNDTVLVAKSDIASQELSNQSMMPEGLLASLQPEEVRDLIAYLASSTQVALGGPRSPIDSATGRVPGAIEGETLKVLARSAGSARGQKMDSFTRDRWSGADQLWWTGAAPGARLEIEIPVEEAGKYDLDIVLTRAQGYGIVQLLLDGEKLGSPIDLYHPEVVTTGVLTFGARELTAGSHKLMAEIVGANPKAEKAYMFGLDWVRLVRPDSNRP